MMIKKLLLIWLAGLLCACAPDRPDEPPLAIADEARPALWKVEGPAGSAYLFGSVHLLPEGVEWRTAAIDRALVASDRLVLEVAGLEDGLRVAETFQRMGMSKGLPSLEARVSKPLRDEFADLASQTPMPSLALDRLESWAAALTLASALAEEMQLVASEGVETKLRAEFDRAGKPISGLETLEQQFGYFDRLSEADQRLMLNSVIDEADEARESFERLINAWMRGDVDALAIASREGMMESETVREALLTGRNRNWTAQLEKMLARDETLFVAVGAAHLAGEDALSAMLAERGLKVERLQ